MRDGRERATNTTGSRRRHTHERLRGSLGLMHGQWSRIHLALKANLLFKVTFKQHLLKRYSDAFGVWFVNLVIKISN